MKTNHLHDIWGAPDNSRLVSKQFSFRFPVHIAAKIAALAEIYPQKNRTQIVADLLTVALDDLEKNLPIKLHAVDPEIQKMQDEYYYDHGMKPEQLFELGGTRGKYRNSCNKHFKLLEEELGNDNPSNLYEPIYGSKEFLENFSE